MGLFDANLPRRKLGFYHEVQPIHLVDETSEEQIVENHVNQDPNRFPEVFRQRLCEFAEL